MSGENLPAASHSQPWLIVGSPACREQSLRALRQTGTACAEADDPYAAMLLICQRPNHYAAVVLSLYSLYRDELAIISAISTRFRQLPIWLTHAQGNNKALQEAIRLGAKGILDTNGAHPMAPARPSGPHEPADAAPELAAPLIEEDQAAESPAGSNGIDEPVLSAEELRALLEDEPAVTPPATES